MNDYPIVPMPTGPMKAISLNPPFGTLIAACERFPDLGKHIETRGWPTRYRGPLAIHQTVGLGDMFSDERELAAFCLREPFRSTLKALGITSIAQLPRGKVVAVCQLVDVRPIPAALPVWMGYSTHDKRWQLTDRERAFGNYDPGHYAWLLDEIAALSEPIIARGMPGLWDWNPVTTTT